MDPSQDPSQDVEDRLKLDTTSDEGVLTQRSNRRRQCRNRSSSTFRLGINNSAWATLLAVLLLQQTTTTTTGKLLNESSPEFGGVIIRQVIVSQLFYLMDRPLRGR